MLNTTHNTLKDQTMKTLIFTLLAIFFMSNESVFAQQARQLFQVNANGSADFSSLQEAVDAANPGAVIEVAPGNYTGPVIVRTENLTLLGAGASQTFIQSDDVALVFQNVSTGRVDGFTIRYDGTDPHATVLIIASSITLSNNVITGASLSGVEVRGLGGQSALLNNLIVDNDGSGVFVSSGGMAALAGNTIRHNGQAGQPGIEVVGPAAAVLQKNLIEANGGSGVFIHEGAYVELNENLIVRNGFHGVAALAVDQRSQLVMTDNTILFNEQLGVRMRGEHIEANLHGNVVLGNTVGLLTDNAPHVVYEANIVALNGTDYLGKDPDATESQLNTNLQTNARLTEFNHAVASLQVASEDTGVLFSNTTHIHYLQTIYLVSGELLQSIGLIDDAKTFYEAVINSDPNTAMAEIASQYIDN